MPRVLTSFAYFYRIQIKNVNPSRVVRGCDPLSISTYGYPLNCYSGRRPSCRCLRRYISHLYVPIRPFEFKRVMRLSMIKEDFDDMRPLLIFGLGIKIHYGQCGRCVKTKDQFSGIRREVKGGSPCCDGIRWQMLEQRVSKALHSTHSIRVGTGLGYMLAGPPPEGN